MNGTMVAYSCRMFALHADIVNDWSGSEANFLVLGLPRFSFFRANMRDDVKLAKITRLESRPGKFGS